MKFQKTLTNTGALASALILSTQASAVDFQAGDSTVSLYGYAKLDVLYDVGDVRAGANGLGEFVKFNNIALDGPTTSGHTDLHANESRLGVRTRTPTDQGDLVINIEGDFFFGGLRMRQAYGSWNGVTAGQTWTNFHTFAGTTPTLDFTGPIGRDATLRQTQLRYSWKNLHVALEDPNGAVSGTSFEGGYNAEVEGRSIAGADVDRKDGLPDLTLRYESGFDNVKYSTAAVLREVAFDDGDVDDSVIGWGAFVAGSVDVTPSTTLRGQVTAGDGVGAYMKLNPAPAAYRVGNNLETVFSWGGTLGISQDVGPGTLSLAYSYVDADWDDALEDGVVLSNGPGGAAFDSERQLIHLNYMWKPTQKLTYGVEISQASRTAVDDRDGDVTRVQGSAIYAF